MDIVYKTQIENEGWNIPVRNGEVSGTEGKGLRMEAIIISLENLNGLDVQMEYQTHVENIGWQGLMTDGQVAGTVGQGLRLEALRIRLTGVDAKKFTVKYQVHVENCGWTLWKKDGETAGTTDVGLRAEAIKIVLEKVKEDVVITVPNNPTDDPTQIIVPITDPNAAIPPEKILCASYSTHIENIGWLPDVTDGRMSGRAGQGLRMEAIRISIINQNGEDLGVAYQTHVENIGWQETAENGETAGTTDQGLRLEAIKIWLTGADAYKYSIWYRTHVQNEAWQEWCRDGQTAGTENQALRAECIEIIITLKSENILRDAGSAPLIAVNYRGHVQNLGWNKIVKNGQMCGTTGIGMRLEALEMYLSSLDGLDIGISYRTHVQNIGWQEWMNNGQTAGTVGQALQIEAIEIVLTGADADQYTVQYRGHVENTGWVGWKSNGQTLGTTGQDLRLEAISVVLIKNADLNREVSNEVLNQAPIIQVWASDFPRADLLLHDIRTDYRLLSAKPVEGINKTDGFVFEIDPTHPHYNKLYKMRTTIFVYEVRSNTDIRLLFEGRILSDQEGFNKTRKVTCEGVLSYMLDSIQRPATYVNITPEQWLTMVLDNHNMQVTSDKRLHMGICTVLGGDGTGVNISTKYHTYIENQGWNSWVQNGDISGSTGVGLRMEALELSLENVGGLDVGVTYRAYIENTEWQDWKNAGETAGTIGQALRMEAIEIKLIGADAGRFSIQYRSHVENEGWQDWCQDGETSGTTGQGLRIEAVTIIIVSKVDGTNSKLKDGIFRENAYINTYELVKTELLDKLGGVLVVERVGGIKFLNYLENYGRVNEQPIKYGLNLLDYNKQVDVSNIMTVLVPYGKEVDGKPLTIAEVNNDCDYIYDETAVAEYGWISKQQEWPDIDSPSALKYAAELFLAKNVQQGISFDVTAVDLSLINMDISQFQIGDMVRVVSKPHNVDTFLSVSKKERDLFNPGNDRITLGSVPQTLTDRVSGSLGGGINGIVQMTANSMQNMEYVSNELSFMVKVTSEAVTETENRLDEAELLITPTAITETVRSSVEYNNDLSGKASVGDLTILSGNLGSLETDLGTLTSRVSTAEQQITADAIVSTVTQSSTYIDELTGKANKVNLVSEINQSAEGIKIKADLIEFEGGVTFSEVQSIADQAEANAISSAYSSASVLANNAKTGAIDSVETKLGYQQSTTYIHGGNIKTGTITATKIAADSITADKIVLEGYISSDNKLRIGYNGLVTMSELHLYSGGVTTLAMWLDGYRDMKIFNGYGDITIYGANTGERVKIQSLELTGTPYNVPKTTTSASTKITEVAVFYDSGAGEYYLNVVCNGTSRGVHLPIHA